MKQEYYDRIYRELDSLADIKRLSKKYRVSRGLLLVVLTQKIVRETKRLHHVVLKQAPVLSERWRGGESFIKLSRELGFPPGMIASLISSELGVSKKQFRSYMAEPGLIGDPRLRKEVSDVLREEVVYSPARTREQVERGRLVEGKVRDWLIKKNVGFISEEEAKKRNHAKTPDFLLEKSIEVLGRKIFWVECKASFGDTREFSKDYKKQLKHYVELYGPGMVLYWYGFLEGIACDKIFLASGKLFNGGM